MLQFLVNHSYITILVGIAGLYFMFDVFIIAIPIIVVAAIFDFIFLADGRNSRKAEKKAEEMRL